MTAVGRGLHGGQVRGAAENRGDDSVERAFAGQEERGDSARVFLVREERDRGDMVDDGESNARVFTHRCGPHDVAAVVVECREVGTVAQEQEGDVAEAAVCASRLVGEVEPDAVVQVAQSESLAPQARLCGRAQAPVGQGDLPHERA